MTCANCSKSIRTDAGMAFHLTWCKPAEPVAEPVRGRIARPAQYLERPDCPAVWRDELGATYGCVRPEGSGHRVSHMTAGGMTWRDAAPEPHPAGRSDDGEPEPTGPAFAHDFGQPCSCDECGGPEPTHELPWHVHSWQWAVYPGMEETATCRVCGADRPVPADALPIVRCAWPEPPTYARLVDHPTVAELVPAPRATTIVDYSRPMPAGFTIADPFGALAEPTRKATRKAAEPKSPRKVAQKVEPKKSTDLDRLGDGFLIGSGPNRVHVSVGVGHGAVDGGERALAAWRKSPPKYRRAPHLDTSRVADPLAISPVPIVGWRAPVSGYPAIEYIAERGAGSHRQEWPSSSWPRLEPIHATAEERRATRKPRTRSKGPGSCWCIDHGQKPGDGIAPAAMVELDRTTYRPSAKAA